MRKKLLFCAAAFSCLFLFRPSAGAALSVSAETDKKTVEISDSLYLTVTVSGDSASVPDPEIPRMDNFNIYSAGRSQSISIVNGSVNTTVAFTYILSPRFLGTQKIPPISVNDGNERRSTPEMEVTVVKAAAAPQGGNRPAAPGAARTRRGNETAAESRLFMTAETDKKSAYPGEQINLAIRFYTSVPLTSNPQYIPPQFKNLISEDLPPVRNGDTVLRGTRYSYSEIKTALFGLE